MIIANYRDLFHKYGDAPEATQMSSEGQRFRFRKLMEIGDLRNRRVLDLGCGIGDFYPLLIEKFGQLDYTGIDIVPEMVQHAAQKYPRARFLCRDLFTDRLDETFDYVLASVVFNNAMPDPDGYMRELLERCVPVLRARSRIQFYLYPCEFHRSRDGLPRSGRRARLLYHELGTQRGHAPSLRARRCGRLRLPVTRYGSESD